ncbi:MAG: YfiR family protein [Candidatus Riflebacteria bacterium]|nr:YfiR family protein [Candidatus Riflebacteria bacterium]
MTRLGSGRVALVGLSILLGALATSICEGQPQAPLVLRVKAAFVYYFALFVDWPGSTLGPGQSKVVLGVWGNDALGQTLGGLRGKRVGDRTLEVVQFEANQDVSACHLLYVAASEPAKVRELLGKLEGQPILTVSDRPGFLGLGGMIQFFIEGETVRFQISRSRASAAGLKLSSKLLQAAKLVDLD